MEKFTTLKDLISRKAQEDLIKSMVKPCPFCGSDNLTIMCSSTYGVKTPDPEAYKLNVRCNSCHADVTFAPNMSIVWAENIMVECAPEFDPFEHWNARAKEDVKHPKIHDLRKDPDDLPEDDRYVLVWYEYFPRGRRAQKWGIGYYLNNNLKMWCGGGLGDSYKVLAWTCLPETPKEQDDGRDKA